MKLVPVGLLKNLPGAARKRPESTARGVTLATGGLFQQPPCPEFYLDEWIADVLARADLSRALEHAVPTKGGCWRAMGDDR